METLLHSVTTLVSFFIGVLVMAKYLKKITTKELDSYIEEKEKMCILHGDKLQEIKTTTRLMLECHDVTLKSIDSIAHGEAPNGEISDQRKKLKDHLLDKFT